MSILPSPGFDKTDMCSQPDYLSEPVGELARLEHKRAEAQELLAVIKCAQEKVRARGDITALETTTRRHGQICAVLASLDDQIADARFGAFMDDQIVESAVAA